MNQDRIPEHNTKVIFAHLLIQDRRAYNYKKKAWEKGREERVKADPARLEIKRAKGRKQTKKFWENLKSDPVKYRAYLDNKAERSRKKYAERRLSEPGFAERHRKRIRDYNKTEKGREVQRNQMAKRREESVQFRIASQCRSRIVGALRGKQKAGSTLDLIGCSIPDLMMHLASQFQDGMDWSNWGKGFGKWTIDHKIPCAAWDLSDPDQQKKCFHYTNLQPLWFEDNCSKNSIVDGVKLKYSDHDKLCPDSSEKSCQIQP